MQERIKREINLSKVRMGINIWFDTVCFLVDFYEPTPSGSDMFYVEV